MIQFLIDKISGIESFLRKSLSHYKASYFARMLIVLLVALIFFVISEGEEPFYFYLLFAFLFEFMTISLIYDRDFYPLSSFLGAYFVKSSFWYNFIYVFSIFCFGVWLYIFF